MKPRTAWILVGAILTLAVLLLTGCGHGVRSEPPVVDCRQPAAQPIDPLPGGDEWVDGANGLARLSERAAQWVASTLVAVQRERALAAAQERCLDGYEKAGVIKR